MSGISAAETICIGDEIRDFQAASAVGTAFGAVLWGYGNSASFESCSPEEIFVEVRDIVEKLAR